MSELFEHLDRLRPLESRVAIATLVNTRGTTPRKEGAKMLVGEGGRVLGSVTIGGCVDAQVIELSADVLGQHAPRLIEMDLGDEAKVAVATLVNTRGTTPRKEGAKMVVGEGGRILGSVTIGGCVDAQVIEESARVLDRNTPRLL